MELSFHAATNHLHGLLDKVKQEHEDEGYTWGDYERDMQGDDDDDD